MKPYIITKKMDWSTGLWKFRELAGPSLIDKQLGRKSEKETYLHPFRLLDADGEVYFEGYSREHGCMEAFDALQDSYGLTDCQYWDLDLYRFATINC
tara:strand:+ start:1055 stop:1345 length:291 start_codon:yes stop_codon:yes gene_type:complete